MPPTIGLEQFKGFSVWRIRAVMSGRRDKVIYLAKENLWPRGNGLCAAVAAHAVRAGKSLCTARAFSALSTLW